MDILYVTKKGKLMNTLERFHIYDETKRNNQINDKNTVHQNIIFDMIIHASTVDTSKSCYINQLVTDNKEYSDINYKLNTRQ